MSKIQEMVDYFSGNYLRVNSYNQAVRMVEGQIISNLATFLGCDEDKIDICIAEEFQPDKLDPFYIEMELSITFDYTLHHPGGQPPVPVKYKVPIVFGGTPGRLFSFNGYAYRQDEIDSFIDDLWDYIEMDERVYEMPPL